MNIKSQPSTIILTMDAVHKKVIASHNHDSMGLTVDNSLKCISLTGIGSQAQPIYLDLDGLFQMTQHPILLPSLDTLMTLHGKTPIDVTNLARTDEWSEINVRRAVVLPPCLYAIVLDSPWASNEEIFLRAVNLIASLKPDEPNHITEDDPIQNNNEQNPSEWDLPSISPQSSLRYSLSQLTKLITRWSLHTVRPLINQPLNGQLNDTTGSDRDEAKQSA
jgi:hypothetical protein